MKVLIVDDSALYRKVLGDIVRGLDFVHDVETAANGNLGLAKAFGLQPDIITLDLEMPDVSGLQVLQALQAAKHKAAVIMVSAHTEVGADLSVRSLELGAVAVILKPTNKQGDAAIRALRNQLSPVIQGLATRAQSIAPGEDNLPTMPSRRIQAERPEVLAIGASTGGPAVLAKMIQQLPGDLPVPVMITVHMPEGFTARLAKSLDMRCASRVVEAAHNMRLEPRTVYLAPGGKHMRVARNLGMGRPRIELGEEPPEHGCRPSVDQLFRSVAEVYGPRAIGVILTGMGRDGAAGLAMMKATGARTLAQDEDSCVVFGMPKAAIQRGAVDVTGPPAELMTYILAALKL
jgi:two-component system chemotaxis response regulator CheB